MKKFILFFMVAAMLVVACSSNDDPTPADTVSAYLNYMAIGHFSSAGAVLSLSGGEPPEREYSEGMHRFQMLSYSNITYLINGNYASATFTMTNFDFFATLYNVTAQLGVDAGHDAIMEIIWQMVADGIAPTFSDTFTIQLILVDGKWLIDDSHEDFAEFSFALTGTPELYNF